MTMGRPAPRSDPLHVPPDEWALPRDVKIAIDYMRANIGTPIRVADLVAATRTPERSLRKHFRQFTPLSPLGFLKRLRLARARDALLGGLDQSVTEIATQCGFTHLGRFLSDYRRGIGELPSATRRRVL
jgi:transcriptional regulator GlxA family with amidase domain